MKNIIISIVRLLFLALFIFLIFKGKMMLWFALFAVSLVGALFFGRIYCGYVCPMNTLMIPTERLSKKLKLQVDNIPRWLRSGKFVWFTMIGSIVVMVLAQKVLHKNIPMLLIWLAVSVLVTLRYKPEVFHNLICPFGLLQKLFGKFAIFSERVHKEKCSGCKLCEKVCPADAISATKDKKAIINTALCLQCSSCQQICPKEAICYSKSINSSYNRPTKSI